MGSHGSDRPSSGVALGLAAWCAAFSGGCDIVAGVRDVELYVPSGGEASWAKGFGDQIEQVASSIAVDGSNDVIIAGWFEGAIDFGGGQLTSAGANDIFIAKFDSTGGHVWSKRFGSEGAQKGYGHFSVATDGIGDVIVAGGFRGTVDFGGGPFASSGEDDDDIFVVKLDRAGNHVFSMQFGDEATQTSRGVATDGYGNVLITGGIDGTVNFGAGDVPPMGPGADAFVLKLDPAGKYVWSRRFSNASSSAIAIDGMGNIILTGQFGVTDFGGGLLDNEDTASIFVAKLDNDGNHLWSKGFGDADMQIGNSVAADGLGNIAITGQFCGNVNFGDLLLTSAGGDDIFVATFDRNGEHLWSKRFGDSSDQQRANGVVFGDLGNVMVAGELWGTVDFGGGKLVSAGPPDIFIVSFDALGNHVWSKRAGDGAWQIATSLAADGAGNVLVTGSLGGHTDFGFIDIQGAGSEDAFVVSLRQ